MMSKIPETKITFNVTLFQTDFFLINHVELIWITWPI